MIFCLYNKKQEDTSGTLALEVKINVLGESPLNILEFELSGFDTYTFKKAQEIDDVITFEVRKK